MLIRLITAVALLSTTFTHGANAEQAGKKMTNADVIALAAAGLRDDIIIAKIHAATATDFDTNVDGLKSLQAAHVSAAVIGVMIEPHASAPVRGLPSAAGEAAGEPNDPEASHSPGIYIYAVSGDGHTLIELQRAAPKQTKGSGAFMSGMTYGIKKYKVRGVFEGASAPVKSSDTNPSFYLYAPVSNGAFGGSYFTPSEFTLVKLTQKNGAREIVEGSGNIWGSTIGTDDKAKRGFTSEQLKPGVYKLTLAQPLPPGEYAFSQNAGTFFDFGISQ